MSKRINRKEDILRAAGPLFFEQGYEGTSVQQIADEVGLTKAALYYHFKAGKEEIFSSLVRIQHPNMTANLEFCKNANSLHELLLCWGAGIAGRAQQGMVRFRWIASEYPRLSEEEQETVHQSQVQCLDRFTDLIEPFVENRQEAEGIAMVVFSATVGYLMVSLGFGLDSAFNNSAEKYMESLADIIAAGR